MEISDYYRDLMQNLYALRGEVKNFTEPLFTEQFCDFLVENAYVDDYDLVEYKHKTLGLKLDAWSLRLETGTLNLFVSEFKTEAELWSLTGSNIKKVLERAKKFFLRSLSNSFYRALEETSQGYLVAKEICDHQHEIYKVQIYLLSNGVLSKTFKTMPPVDCEGKNVCFHIWDIGRRARIELSGKSREDIVINFDDPISCLPAFSTTKSCHSYLFVLPGEVLASLYEDYGERLLEQNVRTFLQFRGKVNKGIKTTIDREPEMFFAYNNGITATAEALELSDDQREIISITNLQIVNGGQTTASLFMSRLKHKLDLSSVYVQVKLSVINPEEVERIVPKISECANTQNKVNAADFSSNHPYHLRIEEFSRRIWAPSSGDGSQETHWFYERTRGQFINSYSSKPRSEHDVYLKINPKKQMITKTDVAKYLYSFEMKPFLVSKGAQFCFKEFAEEVDRRWQENDEQFNELYYKELVAKAIMFRQLDKEVYAQPWYGGYKANIITYSLALLSSLVARRKKFLDFMTVWDNQSTPEPLMAFLVEIAKQVNSVIQDTMLNVTQYAKKEKCWECVELLEIILPSEVEELLIDEQELDCQNREAITEQRLLTGIQAQIFILEKGAVYWGKIIEWQKKARILSPTEMGILQRAYATPESVSERQALRLVSINDKVKSEGFYSDD